MKHFSMYFLDTDPAPIAPGSRFGEIRIGAFVERFTSNLGYWSEGDYEKQWREAATRIQTAEKVAFITSLTLPGASNFIRWWAAYRVGGEVVLQEQIRFLDDLSEPFDTSRPDRFVAPRRTVSEDGDPISEWTIDASALRTFAENLQPNAGPGGSPAGISFDRFIAAPEVTPRPRAGREARAHRGKVWVRDAASSLVGELRCEGNQAPARGGAPSGAPGPVQEQIVVP